MLYQRKNCFPKKSSEPSASVMLKVRNGKKLSKSEINAMSNLIATAIPELKSENVTIIDSKGNPLKMPSDEDSAILNLDTFEYKNQVEKKLEGMIEELLGKSLGAGKVKATVSADIDFDKRSD